jgi:hypothetical protein
MIARLLFLFRPRREPWRYVRCYVWHRDGVRVEDVLWCDW